MRFDVGLSVTYNHSDVRQREEVKVNQTFNMQRFVLLAIVGFCLAAYATANDLELGKREDGDILVATRRLLRVRNARHYLF